MSSTSSAGVRISAWSVGLDCSYDPAGSVRDGCDAEMRRAAWYGDELAVRAAQPVVDTQPPPGGCARARYTICFPSDDQFF
jgi:hypothetical protein